MKRSNWTNEEVMAILDGQKISGKGGIEDEYCKIWNEAVENLKDHFACFILDSSISGAIAYEEKEDMTYHIGPELPR